LVRLLRERGPHLEARRGLRFEVVRILVRDRRRARPLDLAPELLTTDPAELLSVESDLVVEALGGLEPAAEIARGALRTGRDLVTANKALIAAHGSELALLARRTGARLEFEAAVGGGVPLIQTLRDSLAESGVESVHGILNGTSNFILTRLSEGVPYAAALAEAQRAGFAEADPTRDLDGSDAADKIRILAWLAFGVDPAEVTVERRGILPDPDGLGRSARAGGGVVRLVAEAVRVNGRVRAMVRPVIVAPTSEWGRVRDQENLVVVKTKWNGTIRLAGPGAGGPPTASAVLSDIVRIALAGVGTGTTPRRETDSATI
jgi:homoserine dehydrogenase